MAQNVKIAGAIFPDVPAIRVPDENDVYHAFTDVSDTTAAAADVAQGKQFYAADGTLTQGTASGGGGASNVVTGLIQVNASGSTQTAAIPYTGSGYPIAFAMWPEDGYTGSGMDTYVKRYAIIHHVMAKSNTGTAPTYTTAGGTANAGTMSALYKGTSASGTGNTNSKEITIYSQTISDSAAQQPIVFTDATHVLFRIAASSATTTGFSSGLTYRYVAVYSS